MGIRRVATGHTPDGKAVFASDQVIEPASSPLVPGLELYQLWGADETVRLPDAGEPPAAPAWFPPVGGFRFGFFTVPPQGTAATPPPPDADVAAEMARFAASVPGMFDHMEADHPGMHTTATVDFEYVVSGRCILELDDGATVELGPGDTVVQNGTRHAWRNPFDEVCRMVVVLVGAEHARVRGC